MSLQTRLVMPSAMEAKVTIKRRNGTVIEDVSEIIVEPFFFSASSRAQIIGFETSSDTGYVMQRGRVLLSGNDGKCRLEGMKDAFETAIEKNLASGEAIDSDDDESEEDEGDSD